MKQPDLSRAHWFKSSYSGGGGGECVEVAFIDGVVGVRDSKDKTGPALVFAPEAWDAFAAEVAAGRFNRPA